MQKSIPNLTWPKARKMYSELMGIDLTGQHPKSELTPRERRAWAARKKRARMPIAEQLTFGRVSVVRSLSSCGGRRPGPYTKVANRMRYLRRSQRLAIEREKQGEISPMLAAYRKMMAKVTSMFNKSKSVVPQPQRHPRGRG